MTVRQIEIITPRWAKPLLEPKRYKLIKGGRMSGKSHERAEALVEAMVIDKHKRVVCVREIQKSLAFSAKVLIEDKIKSLGVSDLFQITNTEVRRKNGDGVCIFQGMQDHTADSIKSLEGFDISWIEEAHSLSAKSFRLLRPTIIRKKGAEIWATWNPDQPDNAIEVFAKTVQAETNNACVIHVNYDQNPFLNADALEEIEADRIRYPDDFDHVYLGAYDVRSELRVFRNWQIGQVDDLEEWDGPYYGADWGFANDPTTLIRARINHERKQIYLDAEAHGIGVDIDRTPALFEKVPGCKDHTIRADSARPETISYMNRDGFKVVAAEKGKGSVEDGITWLKSYDTIIHPSCTLAAKEFRLYSYQTNKAGDILAKVEDRNNHMIDALRYALEPLIKKSGQGGFYVL